MKIRLHAVAIIISVVFLASCGGGSGGGGGGGSSDGGNASSVASVDTDKDGVVDNVDTDDDGDGVLDLQDAFPLNKDESIDTDADGIGNVADADDDGDGVADAKDVFPLDKSESVDFDVDGKGDNTDTDDDNDGISDDQDDSKSIVADLTSNLSSATEFIFDATRNYVYISKKSDFSLSILSVQTGEIVKTITFSKMPESLFLSHDKSKLYVALLDQEHNSYLFDAQKGSVGIIDLDSLTLSKTLTINTDPYDLVVTKSGKLVVTSGSGQWTNIYAYDATNGAELGHSNIRQMSKLTLHPSEDWVFTTDTDSSPSDMNKYDIRGVGIIDVAESPYHGDHRIAGEVWATPDGKYLIAKGGDIFLASDMTYVSSITAGYDTIKQVGFDPLGNVALITLANDSVLTLNLASLEPIKTLKTFGVVNFTAQTTSFVYVLVTSGGVTSLLTQEPPCDCANNKAPKALFAFTPTALDTSKTITFDASTSSDPDGDSLSYRWDIDSDGIWDTTFSTSSKYEKRFTVPGVKYVRLQVKDVKGMVSTQTQSLDVAQGVDTGFVVVDSIPTFLNFSITDVVTDKINSKLYISDKNAKRVYVVDFVTGVTEKYFAFEGMPESLSLSPDGSKLFVALLSKDHNAYHWNEERLGYIAVINTSTQTYTKTFALKKDIYNIVGVNNDRVIVAGTSNQSTDLQAYDATSGLAVGASVGVSGRMAVNSTGSTMFVVDSYIKKYDVTGVTPSLINQSDYSTTYRIGSRVWPTPDGKYLITQGGDVYTATDLKFVATKTSVNITVNNVTFDSQNQIAILTLSDGSVDVINLISLESIKKINVLGTVSNISVAGNNLYMVSTVVGFSNIVKLDHPCLDCASNKPPVAAFTYTPLSGNTGSIYQLNATTSSDPENSSLTYRWDLNGDGVWDSDFTSTSTASRKYLIAGTKNIRLQVKDSKGLTSIMLASFAVAQGTDNGVTVTDSVANQLNLKVTDSVTDAVRGKLYISDKNAKRLYIVDLLTGLTEKYFEFEYMPENMALSVDGTKLYVALLLNDHSSYWWDEEQSGYVAVIDLASSAHVNTFAINVDPYDLAATADNHLVVSAGSGQWTTFHVYDAADGQPITEFASIYERTRFVLDATTNIAYFIDFSSLKKIDISNSTHLQSSSSSNESVGNNLWLTPDRKYIITQSGSIFNASDLSFVKRLTASGTTIESVSFDPQTQVAFLSLSSGYVQTINLVSQELVAQSKMTGVPGITAVFNSSLYILNAALGSVTLIKQDHPCPTCATNKAPTANFAFIPSTGNTADTYQFNASTSTDPEVSTLSYRWDIDGDNIWDTEWVSSALKSYKFLLPGSKHVRLQVKDAQGAVNTYSQTFSVAQGIDIGTMVTGSIPFSLNISATDVVKDSLNEKLYVADKNAKRVYVVDLATGLTEKYFDFQYGAERMTLSADGDFLYVSLPTNEHSYYSSQSGYIGVIDTVQQAYVRTFAISIDPYDLVMAQGNRLIVTSGSGQWTGIHSYNAATGELLGNASIYQNALLAAHPTNGLVFAIDTALSPSDVHKFETQGANLQDLGDSPYHGDHRIYGDIWVTPDGKYIITGGGDILLTSNMTYVRGLTSANQSIRGLAFDQVNNLLIIVNSNLELISYDLAALTQKSVLKTGVTDPKAVYIFNGAVYLMNSSSVIDKIVIQ